MQMLLSLTWIGACLAIGFWCGRAYAEYEQRVNERARKLRLPAQHTQQTQHFSLPPPPHPDRCSRCVHVFQSDDGRWRPTKDGWTHKCPDGDLDPAFTPFLNEPPGDA